MNNQIAVILELDFIVFDFYKTMEPIVKEFMNKRDKNYEYIEDRYNFDSFSGMFKFDSNYEKEFISKCFKSKRFIEESVLEKDAKSCIGRLEDLGIKVILLTNRKETKLTDSTGTRLGLTKSLLQTQLGDIELLGYNSAIDIVKELKTRYNIIGYFGRSEKLLLELNKTLPTTTIRIKADRKISNIRYSKSLTDFINDTIQEHRQLVADCNFNKKLYENWGTLIVETGGRKSKSWDGMR